MVIFYQIESAVVACSHTSHARTRNAVALEAREISSIIWQVPTYTTEQTLNFHHVNHNRHLGGLAYLTCSGLLCNIEYNFLN
jgi:hypothetical protein